MTARHLLDQLVLVPVIVPLLGAGLSLALGRSARAQRIVSITVLSIVVATAATLVFRAGRYGPQAFNVGGWPSALGISLVADRLSAILLLTSSVVTLAVLLYSIGQGVVEFGRDTPLSVFYPTFLVLSAGVSNAFLAADLFNLFVGFEVLLSASYVLITLGGTAERVRSGTVYVVVNLLSSMLFLITLAAVYAATSTVNLAQLATRMQDISPGVATVLQLLMVLTFSVKAAVFPLYAWLPDSYPTAPAPVTAVFAGLLTKVGVYAIIRTQLLMFPHSHIRGLLLVAAIATMLVGILGAVAQSDIKRVLSFTLVSHIGYMLFGIAVATTMGVTGAIFYTVHHITVQTTLFLVAGLIEYRSGTTSLDELGGLARAAPVLSLLFFVPAMNLAGIPPFSGFLGKLALVEAGIADPGWLTTLGVGAAIVTSLLTLYAIAKVWNRAFWQPLDAAVAPPPGAPVSGSLHRGGLVTLAGERRLPLPMALPTLALAVAGIGLTVFAGPLMSYSHAAAVELIARQPYIEAVLGR